jgi:hypothetical protein
MENGMENLNLVPVGEKREEPPLSPEQLSSLIERAEPQARIIQVEFLSGKIDQETASSRTKELYREVLAKITSGE